MSSYVTVGWYMVCIRSSQSNSWYSDDDKTLGISKDDLKWLEDEFAHHQSVSEYDKDILTYAPIYSGCVTHADEVEEIPLSYIEQSKPPQEVIDRLQKLMKYEEVIVRFGIVVTCE